ncbi:hypothetical protein OQA88_10499 [Cercophora sp. LCS_1]
MALRVKALTFDIFGTTVNWRSSINTALTKSLSSIPGTEHLDIHKFAQEWRDSYIQFTRGFVPGVTEYKSIDEHHLESLEALLRRYEVSLGEGEGEGEVERLSREWHNLEPWADTVKGIERLNTKYTTAMLSNGNIELLDDLEEFGKLGFKERISAGEFGAYADMADKPWEGVYRGACKRLGVKEEETAMVAAHLGDLEAARKLGMRTIFVQRPGEENLTEERVAEAKKWVDIWISEDEGGFEELATRLGV